jgi:hypothetical protein
MDYAAKRPLIVYLFFPLIVALAAALAAYLLNDSAGPTVVTTEQTIDNSIHTTYNGNDALPQRSISQETVVPSTTPAIEQPQGDEKVTRTLPADVKEVKQEEGDLPTLTLVRPTQKVEPDADRSVPELVNSGGGTNNDPYGLQAYYGLALNLKGSATDFVMGSDAILLYFKLKGGKHKGLFIISATNGLYFSGCEPVYNKPCSFYKIYATHVANTNAPDNPCATRYFSLYGKLKVYPCEGNVHYKVGDGKTEEADEYRF